MFKISNISITYKKHNLYIPIVITVITVVTGVTFGNKV